METKIDEIADGIYRLSTFVSEIAPPAGFTFNQFLILGDERLFPPAEFPLIRKLGRRSYARSPSIDCVLEPLSFRASIQGRHRLPSSSVRQRDASQTCRSVVNKRRTVLDRCCTRT